MLLLLLLLMVVLPTRGDVRVRVNVGRQQPHPLVQLGGQLRTHDPFDGLFPRYLCCCERSI